MAISQDERMAGFGASDRRSVGMGYWIPLREVQGLYSLTIPIASLKIAEQRNRVVVITAHHDH